MVKINFKFLLHGIDTVQCAYFLRRSENSAINFEKLSFLKEEIQQSKSKNPAPVRLGGRDFLLKSHGSKSGFPFILENEDFKIELGEFNVPNFFVTFRSQALWRESAYLLHQDFLKWAGSAGLTPYKEESLSRVDFCFDYQIPNVDFNEDCFKSRSSKDSQHRENGKVQTFTFGKGDVVLRVYDKVTEIEQQSQKVWFFMLWEENKDVWRIEWQIRKEVLNSMFPLNCKSSLRIVFTSF